MTWFPTAEDIQKISDQSVKIACKSWDKAPVTRDDGDLGRHAAAIVSAALSDEWIAKAILHIKE